MGNSLSPMKIESSLKTLVAKNDIPIGVEINISNVNEPIARFKRSTNDAKLNDIPIVQDYPVVCLDFH